MSDKLYAITAVFIDSMLDKTICRAQGVYPSYQQVIDCFPDIKKEILRKGSFIPYNFDKRFVVVEQFDQIDNSSPGKTTPNKHQWWFEPVYALNKGNFVLLPTNPPEIIDKKEIISYAIIG